MIAHAWVRISRYVCLGAYAWIRIPEFLFIGATGATGAIRPSWGTLKAPLGTAYSGLE